MTEPTEKELVIGTVVAPFGIKGEAKVQLHTDYPERYYDLDEVDVRLPNDTVRSLKIEGVRFHKGAALVKFETVNSIDDVENLRGANLVVPESESVELPEDEFFIHDLIGIRVFGVDGRDYGEIKEVMRGKANDAYITEVVTIPALKSVVREVDIPGGKMIVDLPESLSE